MLGLDSTKDYEHFSDEEILLAARSKPWVFVILVRRYEAAFTRKARSIIFNPLDVEEVVQDTFTKIYINAHKYEPQSGAQFSSWAYRILLNTAFTRYQKLVKEGQRFSSLDPDFEQFIGEQKLHNGFALQQDGIERVLERLPGHFAAVLRLHYLERWSHQDIAQKLGENVGTIKARIHRAKAAFRKEAKDEEKDLLADS
jgi:RNA polymerase sigma-70 factor (ECF subfamily)